MKLSTRIGIVGFTFGSCALAAWLQHSEMAAQRDPSPFELYDAVQTQLTAIRAQHFQEAYLQASSRYMDTTNLEHFIETARGANATVRQATRWEFGCLTQTSGQAEVPVCFFIPNGEALDATYTLIRENRTWKIDHVQFSAPKASRSLAGLRL